MSSEIRSQWWFLGFFGSIHEDWHPENSLQPIISAAKQSGKKLAIISLGRLGSSERKWKEISRYQNDRIKWLQVGQLDAKSLSECLQELDYGLTSTPWDLVGKSGAIAALVEHGRPVFVSVEGGTPNAPLVIGENFRHMIHRTNASLSDALVAGIDPSPISDGLNATANKFIHNLSRNQA